MKVITATSLAAATTTFNAKFREGIKLTPVWNQRLAMRIPSEGKQSVYHWMQQLPTLRKWIGEKKFAALSQDSYTLVNEPFEGSVRVNREDIEDDTLDVVMGMFQSLGQQRAKFEDQQLARLLRLGTGTTAGACLDGGAFFAASHTVDAAHPGTSPTYQNLWTSKALTHDNFESVMAAMSIVKDASGEVIQSQPDLLVVPPALRPQAMRIAKAQVQAVTQGSGAAAIDNVNAGLVDVLVLPELSSAYSNGSDTTWYLASTKGPFKPLIHQPRIDRGLISRTDPQSDAVFNTNVFEYSVELRAAFGYAFPWLMARCEA